MLAQMPAGQDRAGCSCTAQHDLQPSTGQASRQKHSSLHELTALMCCPAGVAEPCLSILQNEKYAYEYTAKGHLVGVITNGTAVLGLGNIGPLAGGLRTPPIFACRVQRSACPDGVWPPWKFTTIVGDDCQVWEWDVPPLSAALGLLPSLPAGKPVMEGKAVLFKKFAGALQPLPHTAAARLSGRDELTVVIMSRRNAC